jgi:hypothetical protein
MIHNFAEHAAAKRAIREAESALELASMRARHAADRFQQLRAKLKFGQVTEARETMQGTQLQAEVAAARVRKAVRDSDPRKIEAAPDVSSYEALVPPLKRALNGAKSSLGSSALTFSGVAMGFGELLKGQTAFTCQSFAADIGKGKEVPIYWAHGRKAMGAATVTNMPTGLHVEGRIFDDDLTRGIIPRLQSGALSMSAGVRHIAWSGQTCTQAELLEVSFCPANKAASAKAHIAKVNGQSVIPASRANRKTQAQSRVRPAPISSATMALIQRGQCQQQRSMAALKSLGIKNLYGAIAWHM